MDLTFQKKNIQFLRQIIHEVQYQEETMESIVPDSFPDVSRIVDSSAVAVLRGKECRNGSITITGGIRATVLYVPEDESAPRNLELYIPFSVKREHPDLTEDHQVLAQPRIRSADVRMVNSRKVLMRVNLAIELTAYERAEQLLWTAENQSPELQIRRGVYNMMLATETRERTFPLMEDLELPAGKPPVESVYKFMPTLEVTEQKLIGSKAVFKGMVQVQIMYVGTDDTLNTWQRQIPFSQYCELNGEYDEDDVSVELLLTGCELEPDRTGDCRRLLLTLQVLAQCVVYQYVKIELSEDAYCLHGELNAEWQEFDLQTRLDRQIMSNSVRETVSAPVHGVVDTTIYLDYPEQQSTERGLTLNVPITAGIVYYDEEGKLQGMTAHTKVSGETRLAPNAQCHVTPTLSFDSFAAPTVGGAELRCTVGLRIDSFASQHMRTMCGGEVLEAHEPADRPSVIVRTVHDDEPLWLLAKENRTTVERIRAANGFSEEILKTDGVVLIPM